MIVICEFRRINTGVVILNYRRSARAPKTLVAGARAGQARTKKCCCLVEEQGVLSMPPTSVAQIVVLRCVSLVASQYTHMH